MVRTKDGWHPARTQRLGRPLNPVGRVLKESAISFVVWAPDWGSHGPSHPPACDHQLGSWLADFGREGS